MSDNYTGWWLEPGTPWVYFLYEGNVMAQIDRYKTLQVGAPSLHGIMIRCERGQPLHIQTAMMKSLHELDEMAKHD